MQATYLPTLAEALHPMIRSGSMKDGAGLAPGPKPSDLGSGGSGRLDPWPASHLIGELSDGLPMSHQPPWLPVTLRPGNASITHAYHLQHG